MKKFLNSIRKEEKQLSLKRKIINTILLLLLGIILGLISKWLDSRYFDIPLLDYLDLGNFFSNISIWLLIALFISVYSASPKRASINVFIFFLGMTISYHSYTIIFNGFNPKNYMLLWYGITLVSPILAYFVWYVKSDNKYTIILSSIIVFVMSKCCFSIGMWYFNTRGLLYTVTFLTSLYILHTNVKKTMISFIIGLLLSFIIYLPFLNG